MSDNFSAARKAKHAQMTEDDKHREWVRRMIKSGRISAFQFAKDEHGRLERKGVKKTKKGIRVRGGGKLTFRQVSSYKLKG